MRSLNSNKAHGWDGISIRMIKICDETETIALPLKIIFDTALKSGSYPDKWKRANVVPVHKKESKNILKRIIDQYNYYLSAEIFLKSVFITPFILILNLMIYYPNLNQVFAKVILVYLSYWQ